MADTSITPDDKDWTWVLETTCPECGHDVRSFDVADIGSLIRSNAAEWQQILTGSHDTLRLRPRSDKWSPLEYAAHVRDVFELYDERLGLMLEHDGPHYPDWNQDETAVAERYNEQDPAEVATVLVDAAERLAARFDTVSDAMWDRTGFRSDGAAFTVRSFARYLIHDPVHHLWDVRTP